MTYNESIGLVLLAFFCSAFVIWYFWVWAILIFSPVTTKFILTQTNYGGVFVIVHIIAAFLGLAQIVHLATN
jgi:hypothetical protein